MEALNERSIDFSAATAISLQLAKIHTINDVNGNKKRKFQVKSISLPLKLPEKSFHYKSVSREKFLAYYPC